MRRFRHFSNHHNQSSEINISPLIDVVFILLIFFIVTTVFVDEAGVEINKPRAASAKDLQKNAIIIAVTAGGEVYQAGRSIGIDGISSVVAVLLEGDDTLPVIIQGDADARNELTVRALDAAKLAGAKTVYLATNK